MTLYVTFLLLFFATSATASFNFFVTVHSYDNPTNKCPECRDNSTGTLGCCDRFFIDEACFGVDNCDNSFCYCLRNFGTPNTSRSCTSIRYNSSQNADGVEIDFSRSSVLGLPNPLQYQGMPGAWVGIQVFLEVIDVDPRPWPDDLVDTFSIDVEQIPVGEETRPQVFNGTFGFAYIEMSFKVECSVSHYFPNCDTSCELEGNCTCLSGYTGPLCEVNINDCIGVNCSGNGECIDGVNAFNCNCFHGYSGNMCKVNIDDCIGVNCSGNGNCSDKVGSFTCDCDIGYSGALCQDEQPNPTLNPLATGLGVAGGVVLVLVVVLVVLSTTTTTVYKRHCGEIIFYDYIAPRGKEPRWRGPGSKNTSESPPLPPRNQVERAPASFTLSKHHTARPNIIPIYEEIQ